MTVLILIIENSILSTGEGKSAKAVYKLKTFH